LSLDAVQANRIWPALGSVSVRLPGAVGGCVSPVPVSGPDSSNSATCAAGQPVLAVMSSRTKRVVAVNAMATVLAPPGVKSYPAGATMSENDVPFVLPRTASVCGSLSTTRSTALVEPRSAWIHCGNALLLLSQYVPWLPSMLLPTGKPGSALLADTVALSGISAVTVGSEARLGPPAAAAEVTAIPAATRPTVRVPLISHARSCLRFMVPSVRPPAQAVVGSSSFTERLSGCNTVR
jgi:hypothetical protein